jgi:hypothetical protein
VLGQLGHALLEPAAVVQTHPDAHAREPATILRP